MAKKQVVQRCPNCSAKYDVGIYVSGQKVRCRRCGIKFAVVRNDTHIDASAGKAKPPARPANKKQRVANNDVPLGTALCGYEVGAVIGRGAMGTVYKGTQISLERPVAIKIMSADLVSQPEFVLRFKREAAALASLAHTNVVAIIDQGQVDDNFFFVMEFVEGPTLRRVLSRKSLALHECYDVAAQIGRGLDYAHSKGVVHRDLKPENVLLADEGGKKRVAKICDFGLADILYCDRSYVNLTGSRISMGTVNYMAPEQRQDAGGVDQRADVYSYGVLLYEMFAGELPLGRYLEPSRKNRALDPRLDAPIMRALDTDPRRRFPNVRDLVQAIESAQVAMKRPAMARRTEQRSK